MSLGLGAQAIISSSNIALQGLLKNDQGEPVANVYGLELDFEIYYLDSSNSEVSIKSISGEVKTDAYGVFNYVINLSSSQVETIGFYPSYAKILVDNTTIFDQQLRAVPYAIHAKNGYPTGTVMPFVGDQAPAGWLLCDGEAIPDNYFHQSLIDLIGSNTPNLKAVFLRGTGTRSVSGKSYSGEDLGEYGYDRNVNHNHGVNLTTSENGEHRHAIRRDSYGSGDGWAMYSTGGNDEGFYNESDDDLMARNPAHQHNFNGNTGYAGSYTNTWEQRPVNYGINYIIKI